MSSELQKQASRENGAKSRGPRSLAGRAHSAGNNNRHTMLARTVVLDGESRERFLALVDSLIAELRPSSVIEHCLIDTMAVARWRQMRIWGMEKAELALEIDQEPAAPARQDGTALNQSPENENEGDEHGAHENEGEEEARENADGPENDQPENDDKDAATPAASQPQDTLDTPALIPASNPKSEDDSLTSAGPRSSLKDQSKRDAPTRAALALRNVTLRGRSFELMNRYESRYDRQFHSALDRLFQIRERMKISARTQELVD